MHLSHGKKPECVKRPECNTNTPDIYIYTRNCRARLANVFVQCHSGLDDAIVLVMMAGTGPAAPLRICVLIFTLILRFSVSLLSLRVYIRMYVYSCKWCIWCESYCELVHTIRSRHTTYTHTPRYMWYGMEKKRCAMYTITWFYCCWPSLSIYFSMYNTVDGGVCTDFLAEQRRELWEACTAHDVYIQRYLCA